MKSFNLFLILILVTFGVNPVIFSQSKKKLNIQLIAQHDSLVQIITKNQPKIDSITTQCENANESLLSSQNNFRTPTALEDINNFTRFYDKIEYAKEEFFEESTNYLDELKNRYVILTEKEFSDYLTQIVNIESSKKNYTNQILTQKYKLDKLTPNLTLAVKVRNKESWNNAIFAQNQSLNYFIELQESYIKNQTDLASRINKEVQENLSLYQDFSQLMNQTTIEDESLTFEALKWSKEKEKKEAERARLEAIYWKKNKGKTIQFIPPVITDEERNPIQMELQKGFDEEIPEPQIERIEPKHEPIVEMKPEKRQEEIYTIVDEPAEFIGGNMALKTYLRENLLYPESAREIAIEGKVYVRFIISKNGEISNVTVLRGIPDCIECDKEAIRLIKSMPKWKPSKINGKEVNSTYNLPVIFKIE